MINPGLMAYNVLEQRAKAAGGPNAFCDLLYRQGLEKGISIGGKDWLYSESSRWTDSWRTLGRCFIFLPPGNYWASIEFH